MGIEYKRTVVYNYGDKMTEDQYSKFASDLQTKGIKICPMFIDTDRVDYGFKEVSKSNSSFAVLNGGEVMCLFTYESSARTMQKALEDYDGFDLSVEYHKEVTNKKQWVTVKGQHLKIDKNLIELDGEQSDYWEREIKYNDFVDSGGRSTLKVEATMVADSTGLKLKFKTSWKPTSVQRKETIEKVMVDTPLNDMAKIQKVVESRLKLKKFGKYDVDNATIDCRFDALTASTSECAPDIIAKVREAKNNL